MQQQGIENARERKRLKRQKDSAELATLVRLEAAGGGLNDEQQARLVAHRSAKKRKRLKQLAKRQKKRAELATLVQLVAAGVVLNDEERARLVAHRSAKEKRSEYNRLRWAAIKRKRLEDMGAADREAEERKAADKRLEAEERQAAKKRKRLEAEERQAAKKRKRLEAEERQAANKRKRLEDAETKRLEAEKRKVIIADRGTSRKLKLEMVDKITGLTTISYSCTSNKDMEKKLFELELSGALSTAKIQLNKYIKEAQVHPYAPINMYNKVARLSIVRV
jgi:hypothetical protein